MPASNPDITGVILVGGLSRRMGTDKAFLDLNGRPLIERALEVCREVCGTVLLVGNRPERFGAYGLPMVADIYPGSSLGGL
ncbi:MAG TPA: NTP transferase domain-containing protein, partial [Geomobilimonas sp.]|nr:NTP transferase domain-containing protein [Geomobilimonas sp.]